MKLTPQLHQQLLELVYDLLPDDEAAALRERIAVDAELSEAYAQTLRDADLLAAATRLEMPRIPLSPDFDAELDGEVPRVAILDVATASDSSDARQRKAPSAESEDRAIVSGDGAAGSKELHFLGATHGTEVPYYEQAAEQTRDKSDSPPTPQKQARKPLISTWLVGLAASALLVATIGGYARHQARLANLSVDQPRLVATLPSRFNAVYDNRIDVRTSDVVGNPVAAEVEVALFDSSGGEVYRKLARAEQEGRVSLGIPAEIAARNPSRLKLWANYGGRQESMEAAVEVEPDRLVTHLSLDKPVYMPGEAVFYRSLTLNHARLTPPDELAVEYEIRNAQGEPVAGSAVAGLTDRGVGSGAFVVPDDLPGGEYTLSARSPEGAFAPQERKFQIAHFRTPRINKQLEFLRESYNPGDRVVAHFAATRPEQGPAAKAQVEVVAKVDEQTIFQTQAVADDSGGYRIEFELPEQLARGKGELSVMVDDGGTVETIAKTIPIHLGKVNVEFFPEGGELVAGLSNRVYFKATNPLDKPVELEGLVVDSKDNEVAQIKTEHDGLGRFGFQPLAAESYRLKVTNPAGTSDEPALPPVNPSAPIVLNTGSGVFAAGKPLEMKIVARHSKLPLAVSAVSRGLAVGQQVLTTQVGQNPVLLTLPEEVGGVVRVTVYDFSDPQLRPVAERLVYRKPSRQAQVSLGDRSDQYAPGETAELTLQVADEKGKPLPAALGVAVVDDAVLKLAENAPPRMATHFFLRAEIEKPEDLEDANFYLNGTPEADRALDLLLGTQGWRRFVEVSLARSNRSSGASLGKGGPPVDSLGMADFDRTGQTAAGAGGLNEGQTGLGGLGPGSFGPGGVGGGGAGSGFGRGQSGGLGGSDFGYGQQLGSRLGGTPGPGTTAQRPRADFSEAKGGEGFLGQSVAQQPGTAQLAEAAQQEYFGPVVEPQAEAPVVYDNLSEILPEYQQAAAAFDPERAQTLGVAIFLGGIAMLVLLALLRVMRMAADRRVWVPTLAAGATCLVIGLLWLKSGDQEPLPVASSVAFNNNLKALPAPAIAPATTPEFGQSPRAEREERRGEESLSPSKEVDAFDGNALRESLSKKTAEPPDEPAAPGNRAAGVDPQQRAQTESRPTPPSRASAAASGALPPAPSATTPPAPTTAAPKLSAPAAPASKGGFGGAPSPALAEGAKAADKPAGGAASALRRGDQGQFGGRYAVPPQSRYAAPPSRAAVPAEALDRTTQQLKQQQEQIQDAAASTVRMRSAQETRNPLPAGQGVSTVRGMQEDGRLPGAEKEAVVLKREYAYRRTDGQPSTLGRRSNFAQTLYWNPLLVTDANGQARIQFDLSDSITTFRVQADAHDDNGRIGSASGELVSRRPISLEPKLPPLVQAGDRIDVPLAIANGTSQPLDLNVNFFAITDSSEDLLRARSGNMQPQNAFQPQAASHGNAGARPRQSASENRRVRVESGQRTREYYSVQAGVATSGLSLNFQADANRWYDEVERTVQVEPPGYPDRRMYRGMIEGSTDLTVNLPADVVAGTLQADLYAFPAPLAELQANLQTLERSAGTLDPVASQNYERLLSLRYLELQPAANPEAARRAKEQLAAGNQLLAELEKSAEGYARLADRPHSLSPVVHDSPDQHVAAAYITWALTEAGRTGLEREVNRAAEQAAPSDDPYLIALAAGAVLNTRGAEQARPLLEKLARLQQADGRLAGRHSPFGTTESSSLAIETTALAALMWMKSPEFRPQADKAVAWLARSRAETLLGINPTTALALQAVVHGRAIPPVQPGELLVKSGDAVLARQPIAANQHDLLAIAGLERHLRPGENRLQLAAAGNQMPYLLEVRFHSLQPRNDPNCPLRISTSLSSHTLKAGETVALTAEVVNTADQAQAQCSAALALPAGLELRPVQRAGQLDELKKSGAIDSYKLGPREVIVSWSSLGPGQKKSVRLDLVAEIPGSFTGAPSRVWLQAAPDKRQWAEPLKVDISR